MIDTQFLKTKINKKFTTQKAFAEAMNVDVSKVSRWCSGHTIALQDYNKIIDTLSLEQDEVEELNGVVSSYYSLRTNTKDLQLNELKTQDVAEKIKNIGDGILISNPLEANDDFFQGVKKISSIDLSQREILLKEIRSFMRLSDTTPLTFDHISAQFANCKFLITRCSFESLGIHQDQETKIRGFSVRQGRSYAIVYDMDRPLHSVFFTIVHELVHILTDTIGKKDHFTESTINYLTGELIYPAQYIMKWMPDLYNKQDHQNITMSCISPISVQKMFAANKTFSPRGLARFLCDNKVIKKGKVYDYFNKVLHCDETYQTRYEENLISDYHFNHLDFDQVISFYTNVVIKRPFSHLAYSLPLRSIHKGLFPLESFGYIFNMDKFDVKELYGELAPLLADSDFFA